MTNDDSFILNDVIYAFYEVDFVSTNVKQSHFAFMRYFSGTLYM